MKMILKIFRSDMKALFGNFFVLAIALGLCALPALYAWFNIYSNRDPYGSTGNLRIAAASRDKGFTDAAGKKSNAGEEVIKSLKDNKSIRWVCTSPESARKRVDSGDCYAAIILPEDFSANMYDGFRRGLKRPKIQYLVNEKKNAVATKITDTAVSNLENSLDEMYISILVSNVFAREAQMADKIREEQAVTRLQERIAQTIDTVSGYDATLASLRQANGKMGGTLEDASKDLESLKQRTEEVEDLDSNLLAQISRRNRTINHALSSASLNIEKANTAISVPQRKKLYQKAASQLEKAKKELSRFSHFLKPNTLTNAISERYHNLTNQAEAQITNISTLKKRLDELSESKKDEISTAVENAISNQVNSILETCQNIVIPASEELGELMDTLARDTKNALSNIAEDADLLQTIITGADTTLQSADSGLASLSQTLRQITQKLDEIHTSLGTLSDSELLQKISDFVQRDPKGYGAFFAAPVKIKTQRVYPVENYGSGVTPFYTTLAIWVGGIFLVSLLKVKPNADQFPGAKPHELFLGRYILFFLLGQLQALVIVVGNLALLHTQCQLPRHFWLAAALASLTFSLLIYTLTLSFGDIGKAIIVVIVVIQIAGSSGTFPIEILPAFYRKMHIFFPFPYAINAMREAICGMNGNDYLVNLLELLLFAAAALLIGLVVRLPFRRLSHFVETRMEDTELF